MSGQRIVKDKHGAGLNATMGTVAWIVAICTLGVMLPWALAVARGKRNSTAIFVVNLLTFWTIIGWVVALVMALMPHQRFMVSEPPRS